MITPNWTKYATNCLIMFGAMLVAVQLRLRINLGETLYPNYDAQPFLAFLILLPVALGGLAAVHAFRPLHKLSPARQQYLGLLLSIAVSFLAIAFLLPDVSLLQLLYYVLGATMLGFAIILLPSRALASRRRPDILQSQRTLWQNRNLLGLWIVNNVRARYSQTVLGILWIILLPVVQALIFSFIFSQVIRVNVGDVPFISFYLAGVLPWTFFNSGVMNSTGSITSHMGLINQIYFPREILVLVRLGELSVDLSFSFLAMLTINALNGLFPNVYFIYLPLLILILASVTLGLMLFFSYLTVFIRDIPQLVFVTLQLLFYLTPILYPVELIPSQFRAITLVNPLVPVIQAIRDVIVYQRAPDIISLYYPLVVGIALLYLGYSFFKAYERRLSDYI